MYIITIFLKQKLSDLTILSFFLRNLLLASAGFRMTFQLRRGRKRGVRKAQGSASAAAAAAAGAGSARVGDGRCVFTF